jgi:uncharacterized protein YndB with AHSA1/START domain
MAEASSAGRRVAVITREFDAPRELVWRAWTEPEHFAHWFGSPPYTTPVDTVSLDVRPGGAFRATMVSSEDGSEIPFRGVYREVVEPERLVLTFEDVNDPADEKVEVLTVTFTDLGGRTRLVATQTGHMPEEQYPRLEAGYAAFFDRLAARLEELRATGA